MHRSHIHRNNSKQETENSETKHRKLPRDDNFDLFIKGFTDFIIGALTIGTILYFLFWS